MLRPASSSLLLPGQRRWAAFSPDGRLVVRKTGATTAVVWDLQARQALSTLRRYDGILTYGASFSPDGRLIVADRAGGGAAIWNAATGKVQAVLGKGTVYSASFSPDGTLVATGSGDGVVRLWQTVGGKLVGAMKRHRGAVLSTAFAASGRVLVTGSDSDGVRLWDLSSLVPDARLRAHGVLRDLAYGAGGRASPWPTRMGPLAYGTRRRGGSCPSFAVTSRAWRSPRTGSSCSLEAATVPHVSGI